MKDLEQQGDMMAETSSGIIEAYVLKTDSLCMMADLAGENSLLKISSK